MRFIVTLPNEPPQPFKRRAQALTYIHQRQLAGTLPDSATIKDTKTGTVLKVPSKPV